MIGVNGKTDYQLLKETAERNSASIQHSEPVVQESGSGYTVTVHLVGYQGRNFSAQGTGLSKQASKILQEVGIHMNQPVVPAAPPIPLVTANLAPKQSLNPEIIQQYEYDTNEFLSNARQGNRMIEFQIFCSSRRFQPNEHYSFKEIMFGEGQDTINYVECKIQEFTTSGAAKKKLDAKKIAMLKQMNHWNHLPQAVQPIPAPAIVNHLHQEFLPIPAPANHIPQEVQPIPAPAILNHSNQPGSSSGSISEMSLSNTSLESNGFSSTEFLSSTPERTGFSRSSSFSPAGEVGTNNTEMTNPLPSSSTANHYTPLESLMRALGISEDSEKVVVESKISYYQNHKLGNEHSSQVYVGFFENIPAAVKRIVPDAFHLNEIREIEILKSIDHRNLVRYFASEVKDNYTYVAMQIADLGTFEDFILGQKGNLSMDLRKQLLKDTGLGLQYLHEAQDIVHRDIKPTNILIFSNPHRRSSSSSNPPTIYAKLADFGISKQLKSQKTSSTTRASGTDGWMSPETYKAFYRQGEKTFKVRKSTDVFSYGMILFFGMCGSHPFAKEEEEYKIQTYIIENEEPYWEHFAGIEENNDFFCLKNLLKVMLYKEPEKRCTIHSVMNHPFFWDSKTTLEFICTISNELKLNEFREQRQKLREAYLNMYGDWGSKMCKNLKQFIENSRSNRFNKKYDFSKVDKLIEFIRDKNEHYDEMLENEDMFAVLFGHRFEKYMDYFTGRFPELLIFLFHFFKDMGFKLKKFYY